MGGLDGAGSVTVGSVAGADLTEGDTSGSAGADAGAFVDVDGDGWGEADAETSTSLGIEGQDPATANADASGFANGAASSGLTVGATSDVTYDPEGSTADASADVDVTADDGDVQATTSNLASDIELRSKAWSKSIVTPNSTHSLSFSKSVARNGEGDLAMAGVISRAKALNTPGLVSADADVDSRSHVVGDGQADALGNAAANVDDDGNMTAETDASSWATLQ